MEWLPTPDRINWPCSLSVLRTVGDRVIFLFGDVHDALASKQCRNCANTEECMQFDYWLRELVERSPVKVDVFIEDTLEWAVGEKMGNKEELKRKRAKWSKREATNRMGSLGSVRDEFRHCYVGQGPCHPNARFHAVDNRWFVSGRDSLSEDMAQALRESEDVYDARDMWKLLRQGYSKIPEPLYTHQTKTQKQLDLLRDHDPKLWKDVYEDMMKQVPKQMRSQRAWEEYLLETRHLPPGPFMGVLAFRIMDAYALARIMKQSLATKLVVVFAGDAHSQNYREFFLRRTGARELMRVQRCQTTPDRFTQCLPIWQWGPVQRELETLFGPGNQRSQS